MKCHIVVVNWSKCFRDFEKRPSTKYLKRAKIIIIIIIIIIMAIERRPESRD